MKWNKLKLYRIIFCCGKFLEPLPRKAQLDERDFHDLESEVESIESI